MNTRKIIIEIIAILYILLFTYTATDKLYEHTYALGALQSQPFPDSWAPILFWAIPFFELTTVVLLLIGKTRKIGFLLGTGMMLVFTIYVGTMLANLYDKIPCACGGAFRHLSWTEHLLFNASFVVIGLVALYLLKKESLNDGPILNRTDLQHVN